MEYETNQKLYNFWKSFAFWVESKGFKETQLWATLIKNIIKDLLSFCEEMKFCDGFCFEVLILFKFIM